MQLDSEFCPLTKQLKALISTMPCLTSVHLRNKLSHWPFLEEMEVLYKLHLFCFSQQILPFASLHAKRNLSLLKHDWQEQNTSQLGYPDYMCWNKQSVRILVVCIYSVVQNSTFHYRHLEQTTLCRFSPSSLTSWRRRSRRAMSIWVRLHHQYFWHYWMQSLLCHHHWLAYSQNGFFLGWCQLHQVSWRSHSKSPKLLNWHWEWSGISLGPRKVPPL